MYKTRCCKSIYICLFLAATAVASPAQTFTPLVEFDGANGSNPYTVSLVQGIDGAFYGTTEEGGRGYGCHAPGCGTAFRITSSGALATLAFPLSFGSDPDSGLIFATDGDFYGTTQGGGANGYGSVFRIAPSGELTTLYSFCTQANCTDGSFPYAALIQAADGNFYGTTWSGGVSGGGTVFRITPAGILTTLHSFCMQVGCADGAGLSTGLVQASDGSFYGATEYGGIGSQCPSGCGTIFRMTTEGRFATLHNFHGEDGYKPTGTLDLGTDGNLYGTTYLGGDAGCDPPIGCGVVFRITTASSLTVLHVFEGGDGVGPIGTLAQATDGNFYGTTSGVGNKILNDGTIFEMSPDGALVTLHNFSNNDGRDPTGGLLQATSGVFYGTTLYGGNLECGYDGEGCGTVYSLDMGLGPFVSLVRNVGKIGQGDGILGQGLSGVTGVSFNGTPASFTVSSNTFIKATVPAGATTGYVTVTTPSGTLTSNVPFNVLP